MLDILDTAGQEEYSVMRDQYINSGQGFLLVYSITSAESLSVAIELHDHILKIKREATSFPIVLIGNKVDLESDRAVSTEKGLELSKQWRIPFFETSAKGRINIEQCFTALVRLVIDTPTLVTSKDPTKPVRPSTSSTPQKKKDLLCILL